MESSLPTSTWLCVLFACLLLFTVQDCSGAPSGIDTGIIIADNVSLHNYLVHSQDKCAVNKSPLLTPEPDYLRHCGNYSSVEAAAIELPGNNVTRCKLYLMGYRMACPSSGAGNQLSPDIFGKDAIDHYFQLTIRPIPSSNTDTVCDAIVNMTNSVDSYHLNIWVCNRICYDIDNNAEPACQAASFMYAAATGQLKPVPAMLSAHVQRPNVSGIGVGGDEQHFVAASQLESGPSTDAVHKSTLPTSQQQLDTASVAQKANIFPVQADLKTVQSNPAITPEKDHVIVETESNIHKESPSSQAAMEQPEQALNQDDQSANALEKSEVASSREGEMTPSIVKSPAAEAVDAVAATAASTKVSSSLAPNVGAGEVALITPTDTASAAAKEPPIKQEDDNAPVASLDDDNDDWKTKPTGTNEDVNPFNENSVMRENVADNSFFFTYFMFFCVLFVAGYIGYHNKQKIIAIVVEGRRGKRQPRGRRPNSANYHKLDSNLEEAVSSNVNKNTTNVIY